jgi:DNA-binding MarR family transcriptional regulator
MNNNRSSESEHLKAKILSELSSDDSLTQRDLSRRLGIALGLVNSYIKNLVSKGFVTVKSIPPKRYLYYLTPEGFAEKTRLTYHLLQDYTRIYREARNNLKGLFSSLSSDGVKTVVFAGVDEVAELAYITLQETPLGLSGVVDPDMAGGMFFGREVMPVEGINEMIYDCIVVTSHVKREAIYQQLLDHNVSKEDIRVIFSI